MNAECSIPDRADFPPDEKTEKTSSKNLKRRNGGRLLIPTIQRMTSDHERLRRRREISVDSLQRAGSSKDSSPMRDDAFVSTDTLDRLDVAQPSSIQRSRPASTFSASALLKQNAQTWFKSAIQEKGVAGLKREFASLHRTVKPASSTAFHKHVNRNRYRDVSCLDGTRVVLEGEDNDYIHANYVSTPMNDKRFICTQGPLANTVVDFWRMIVQERTVKIVMLCNPIENRQRKCAEYFPTKAGESLQFENFLIHCRMQKNLELPKECKREVVIKVRGLEVVTGNRKFFCDHYQILDWPDRGVLPADLSLVSLLNAVRLSRQPIVVHCSAGIGRSAVVIMLDFLIELFESGQNFEDAAEVLEEIRDQRAFSVQNYHQYLFVHRVFLEYLYKQKVFSSEQVLQIKKFVRDYIRATKQDH